jgi:hypothetical protein
MAGTMIGSRTKNKRESEPFLCDKLTGGIVLNESL